MPCEICGRDNVKVYLTNIEGAKLWVCKDCNPSGEGIVKREFRKRDYKHVKSTNSKPIADKKKEAKKEFKTRKKFKKHNYHKKDLFELDDYELIENYGGVLRKAREAKNLTIEDFAKKIRESVSYLQKIENNKLKPNDRILLKIYDTLGINLLKMEEFEDTDNKSEIRDNNLKTQHTDIFTETMQNNKKKIVF